MLGEEDASLNQPHLPRCAVFFRPRQHSERPHSGGRLPIGGCKAPAFKAPAGRTLPIHSRTSRTSGA